MFERFSLRGRIYTLLTALVIITLAGGMIMVWYSFRLEHILTSIIDRSLTAYQTAESLETALVNQKGFVSYYFLDGDPDWLRQMGEYRQIFRQRLSTARRLVENDRQEDAITRIEIEYQRYVSTKDRVIDHYKAGRRSEGSRLHKASREQFFSILSLCENYKEMHLTKISSVRQASNRQARRLRIVAAAAMLGEFLLGIFLALILTRQVLGPVRKLSMAANREGSPDRPDNEIQALSHRVHGLIEDIDQTASELEKSREHLQQAEKMALVGKLAAGMAHSIRNPFTSVKMRLFSLERSLNLSDIQKDDLRVISEEIRHIDTIVQNFLEFSRPPRLKIQKISPSTVVDAAIRLLSHRLKSYDVNVELVREALLPEIEADPEQLKEVLVNLVVNACEAMAGNGAIVIREEEVIVEPLKRMAVIRLSDNGPGIPAAVVDKVFQPFFTTKEDGTGLGLSIASRIVEEHHGELAVRSQEGDGTVFTITLPIKE